RVERHVAAVNHEIGPLRVDILAEPVEILGQRGVALREVRVGNLDQAKFAHAINPSVEIYLHCEMMNYGTLPFLFKTGIDNALVFIWTRFLRANRMPPRWNALRLGETP